MRALLLMAGRSLVMYVFLLIVMRVAGKRELGQVSPFDFVVVVLIGELAAIPLQGHQIPLLKGFIPIATIIAAQLVTAYLSLRSNWFRAIISGRPTVLISGGAIDTSALKRHRFNVNDLMSKLRQQGAFNLSDVETAVLEDTGHLSVVLRSQRRPVMPADLGIATGYEGMPFTLILDGLVDYHALQAAQLDYTWLQTELKRRGFTSPREVLLATLETSGAAYFYPRDSRSRPR